MLHLQSHQCLPTAGVFRWSFPCCQVPDTTSMKELGIRMGLSAPVADRPYFEFASSSEWTTKRVTWGAGIGPTRLSHVVYKENGNRRVLRHTHEYVRGGTLLIWAMRHCPIHWQNSELVVRWYTVMTYDLYIWHQEVRRTGGMERDEVRPPVSHVVVYIPCRKI